MSSPLHVDPPAHCNRHMVPKAILHFNNACCLFQTRDISNRKLPSVSPMTRQPRRCETKIVYVWEDLSQLLIFCSYENKYNNLYCDIIIAKNPEI